jgi:hypothetical protein
MSALRSRFQEEVVAASLIPTERFSFNSHRMLSLRDAVLRVWEEQLRETLPRAGKLSQPVLIDTMPVLYERMCALLTPAYFGRDGIDIAAIGAEHGIERANLTSYDADAILAEFQQTSSTTRRSTATPAPRSRST